MRVREKTTQMLKNAQTLLLFQRLNISCKNKNKIKMCNFSVCVIFQEFEQSLRAS